MAAKRTLEQRISELLSEVELLTGGNARLFVLPCSSASAPIDHAISYGIAPDVELFVSRLYDFYFPTLLTEVRAIEKMGYAELSLEYGIEGIDLMLSELSDIEDATQRETMTNILLDARAKLTHATLPRRRTHKAILKKP